MTVAVFVKNPKLDGDPRLEKMLASFSDAGCSVVRVTDREGLLSSGAEMLLAVGGDGTFLSAATIVSDSAIPVLGVNMGRLGFLSENSPEAAVNAIVNGDWSVEDRHLLKVDFDGMPPTLWPYALNEVTVHRRGAAMLGVDVSIDGRLLPTYWADGLLVATSSGSTAYSLSVGGPIVIPESKVLIVSPIAPHNLNVRPLIVPDGVTIDLDLQSRDAFAGLTMDNRTLVLPSDAHIRIAVAQFSLKRVRLNQSDFINALTEKLFWGEDKRNGGSLQ